MATTTLTICAAQRMPSAAWLDDLMKAKELAASAGGHFHSAVSGIPLQIGRTLRLSKCNRVGR
jgi:hypothetical protein